MTNFQLENFAARGGKLLTATRKIFSDSADLGLKFKPLPETFKPADGAVKLVFVGQYGSGKSSIIKMLSGIETEIGAGIKTQKSHIYPWGDLEIVDTPGIHTEIRLDHDEKTYYEIDHAALLIFVVTNEGFDNQIGNHFRKLAVEQNRGKNMVLVVNKMDRTSLGNTPEQQAIIAQDLQKVITPFTAQDLYLSFLDTESYFDALKETDDELRALLLEQSGHDKFVANLNSFVASRGVLSKVQAPLETLKSSITDVIGESENLNVDKDIEAAEELLRRKQKTLQDGKRRIRAEIKSLADNLRSKIKNAGSNAASKIEAGITEDEAKRNVEDAQLQVENDIAACEREVCERLAEISEGVGNELALIDKSAFATKVQVNIDGKIPASVPHDKANFSDLSKRTDFLSSFARTSKEAAKHSIFGMKSADIVKDIGHFFGFKFAPWGAVNFVKYLGWIGAAWTVFNVIKDVFGSDDERQKMEAELRKAREHIQSGFDTAAETVYTQLIERTEKQIDALTAPVLKDADDKLAEFQSKKSRLQSLGHSLQKILGEVNALMDEVQQTRA